MKKAFLKFGKRHDLLVAIHATGRHDNQFIIIVVDPLNQRDAVAGKALQRFKHT